MPTEFKIIKDHLCVLLPEQNMNPDFYRIPLSELTKTTFQNCYPQSLCFEDFSSQPWVTIVDCYNLAKIIHDHDGENECDWILYFAAIELNNSNEKVRLPYKTYELRAVKKLNELMITHGLM